MYKSLKELGDSFFNEHLEEFVREEPYMSFVILSAIFEFIAKCYTKPDDFHESGTSAKVFKKLTEYPYMKKYKKYKNPLYKKLRCGMVHAMSPIDEIKLVPGKNNLDENKIGAQDLYNDLKDTWNNLCEDNNFTDYLNNVILSVEGSVSGATASNITASQD